jgi:hypothetical protein
LSGLSLCCCRDLAHDLFPSFDLDLFLYLCLYLYLFLFSLCRDLGPFLDLDLAQIFWICGWKGSENYLYDANPMKK